MKNIGASLPRFLLPILAILLALIFHEAIKKYVVGPAASTLWLAWRTASSVNQYVYWSFLILLFLTLPLWTILSSKTTTREIPGEEREPSCKSLDYWRSAIADAFTRRNPGDLLRRSLRNLLVDTIAFIERSNPGKVQEDLALKKIRLPDEIFDFLFPSIVHRLQYRPFHKKILGFSNNYKDVIPAILNWIETYLEKKHEH